MVFSRTCRDEQEAPREHVTPLSRTELYRNWHYWKSKPTMSVDELNTLVSNGDGIGI